MVSSYTPNRRQFIKALGLGVLTLGLTGCGEARRLGVANPRRRRNVLFLFTDDQRFSTLHALNNPEIQTPNMDRLARMGATFTRAHIMGGTSGAICMPSRAMLMTGRTLFHLEKLGAVIPRNHRMLPETLREAGYTTFGTGKWHNSPAAYARCFSTGASIFFGGMSDHLQVPVHDFDPAGKYPEAAWHVGKEFSSELFSDEAIRFLKGYKENKPFMMYVSYTAPHDPRMAPAEYVALYPPEKISLPANFLPEHPFDNGEMKVRDEALLPWPRTAQAVKGEIAGYYAMITHVDHHIGRVLDALEESGHADDTIIVFSGDNGLAVGQHGLLGKQNLYEHSIRVPLIFAGPGIQAGQRTDAMCYLLDLFPTLCELTGVPVPSSVDGMSLVPALRNPKAVIRDSVFYAYKNVQRGVRTDRWKLIKYNVKGVETTQLFDLENDPWEIHNLADDPAQAERMRELTALLKRRMKELDDICDLDKPNWGTGPGTMKG